MRRILLFLLAMFLCSSMVWAQSKPYVKVIYPSRVAESKPLSELAKEWKGGTLHKVGAGDREVQNRPSPHNPTGEDGEIDTAWQSENGTRVPPEGAGVVIEGISSDDNAVNFGFRVMPPDPNADVGPNHVVQQVNLLFSIWDKSGTQLTAPTPNGNIWTPLGGGCAANDGDPVVVYDHVNDRWILSQFDFSIAQCLAISKTSDPTGAYWLYAFPTPGNDYPKLGVREDALYGTIRNFSGAFNMDIVAWNIAKLITGDPTAEMITVNISPLFGSAEGVLPADLDGPAPSASTPGYFVGHDDAGNRLHLYTMAPNFPAGTATVTGPNFIPVDPYNSTFAGGFFGTSIPQPGTAQRLDVLAPFTMFKLHFRDFGTHQTLIANHTVDVQDFNDHAGTRWYELRGSGSSWSAFQQGTYAPDSDHRWMGDAAMNGTGDIGLGYSVSSSATSPSVRYTGRAAGDPSGQMTLAEGTIKAGTGSQLGGSRWGDYSSITVDPSNDATFWYCGEYVQQTGSFEWNTAIGSFDIIPPPPPNMSVTISNLSPPPPITIPPGGGTISYTGTLTNSGGSPTTGDIWSSVSGPFPGSPLSTFQFLGVPFNAGQTRFGNVSEAVPSNAPPGNYTYNLNFGDFATNTIIAFDQFTFTKSTVKPASTPVAQTNAPFDANADFNAEGDWSKLVAGIDAIPEDFVVEQNYPNPFNPSTVIRYGLNKDAHVKVKVFNMLGEEIATLIDAHQTAGFKSVSWNGRNQAGQTVSAGIYLYLVEADGIVKTNKMVFAK